MEGEKRTPPSLNLAPTKVRSKIALMARMNGLKVSIKTSSASGTFRELENALSLFPDY